MNKFIISFFLVTLLVTGCTEKYNVDQYYSKEESDSLLIDLITYIYPAPQAATVNSKFDPSFRQYYVSQKNKFRFERYFISNSGVHYFYLIRPANSPNGNIRGVGGSFKLDKSEKIISFKEIFNTPAGDLLSLKKKGDELFRWMIQNGNVNDYLRNPDFVEWPNKSTYYDTITHEWLIKPMY